MEEYISKSALVAEIERLRDKAYELYGCSQFNTAYNNVLKSIDTLEVKEVDLEKSISDWLFEGLPNDEELIDYIKETAEHFFELGLKAQKRETV